MSSDPNCECKPKTRARTNPLWKFFKRISPGIAKCCVCKRTLSFKSSITNLKRHLLLKHNGAFEDLTGAYVLKKKATSEVFLIALVKARPCLWDTRCESFGNLELQTKAWISIAEKLHPMEEWSKMVAIVSGQFEVLKNEFFSNRNCLYHEQMTFLDQSYEKRSNYKDVNEIAIKEEVLDESTLKEDNLIANHVQKEDLQSSSKDSVCSNLMPNKCTSPKPIIQGPVEENKFNKPLEKTSTAPIVCNLHFNNADEDTLFLLSLVDDIKSVPKEFQMNFKAELLSLFSQLIQTYDS